MTFQLLRKVTKGSCHTSRPCALFREYQLTLLVAQRYELSVVEVEELVARIGALPAKRPERS
ncbi:MAG: hypothetical protein ACREV1_05510 [Gammaproteobacteria bacterium]